MLLGALGAHGLADVLTDRSLSSWDTAVRYHLIHALALFLTGMLSGRPDAGRWLGFAGCAFALGLLFFSGSLYLLALGGPGFLGPLTPLGGISFVAGWIALAVGAGRTQDAPEAP